MLLSEPVMLVLLVMFIQKKIVYVTKKDKLKITHYKSTSTLTNIINHACHQSGCNNYWGRL